MPFGTVRSKVPCSELLISSSLFSDSHLEDPEDDRFSCYTPSTQLTKSSTLIPPAVSILELRIKVTRNVMCHDLSILRTPSRTQIIQRSTSSHFPRTRIRLPDSYIPPFLEKNVPVLFTIENTTTLFTNKLQKKRKKVRRSEAE